MKKLFLSLLLIFIGVVGGVLITDSIYRRYYTSDYVESGVSLNSSSSSIAMMIQTEVGADEYQVYTSTEWPDSCLYTFNSTLSKCEKGSTLSWDSVNNQVIMTGDKSDKCYLYFDIKGSATLQAYESGNEIWAYRSSITKIVFDDSGSTISDYDYVYDVSLDSDESILAYLVNNGDDTYTTYIVSSYYIYANENMSYWFYNFTSLGEINGLDELNTSNVTTMEGLFKNCSTLTTLNLSSWDTSNVTTMEYMFGTNYSSSNSFTSINFGDNFSTSNVSNMSDMFHFCGYLTSLDLSSFDTSGVTDMSGMFEACFKLTSLDLSSFDTSNVTDMSGMFASCEKLTTLSINHFDVSNVTNMSGMFVDCLNLTTLDLSSWDTSSVVYMDYMFYLCINLHILYLSSASFTQVELYDQMFMDCSKSLTVTVKDSDAYDFIQARLSEYNGGTVVIG